MSVRATILFFVGMKVLFLNKIRYTILGYHKPRPFTVAERDRAFTYAHETVARWEKALVEVTKSAHPFAEKRVLELGPGADLAPGLLLLAAGAKRYVGLDKNNLLEQVPQNWYQPLLDEIIDPAQRQDISQELNAYEAHQSSALSWIQDVAFHLRPIADASIDVVVSNNAFEHFDTIAQTLVDVHRVLAPGGWLCAHIDLQTHTGILRERDPLNIYRYPQWLYRLAHFPGIPNRVRPEKYEEVLQHLGWKHIQVIPVFQIPETQRALHLRGVAQKNLGMSERALWLSFLLIGQKP